MDYNTKREKIILPEYGRSIQKMVEHALTIENRSDRQHYSENIISVMENFFPQNKNIPDFKHKLWDHLALISNYQLDIDYPYGTPTAKEKQHPQKMDYPNTRIKYRHYGKILEQFIEQLDGMPENEDKKNLSILVGLQMRKSLSDWNRDANDNEKVVSDLARYTEGRIQMNVNELNAAERSSSRASNVPNKRSVRGKRNRNFA